MPTDAIYEVFLVFCGGAAKQFLLTKRVMFKHDPLPLDVNL